MEPRGVAIDVDGLRLVGELTIPANPRAALVLCHGIPAGPADPNDLGYAGLAATLSASGYATLWFNFRGSRSSPGDFSVAGWCADLGAAVDLLDTEQALRGLHRVAVGSSMGGAVAIVVAARRGDIAGVATLAAVSSLREAGLAEDPRGFLQRLRNAGVVRDPAFPPDIAAWAREFDAATASDHIGLIAPRPVLFVHGTADDVVPYHHAEALFEAAGGPKELVRLDGAGHQLRRDPRAIEAVEDWLDRWLPSDAEHVAHAP